MGEVIAVILLAVVAIVSFIMWRWTAGRLRFALNLVADLQGKLDAIRFQAEAITKDPLTSRPEKAQDKPQKLNAAVARKRMDRANSEFFSADRRVTNSEILKEQ